MFKTGDIVAVRGTIREIALNTLISPQTHRWHHFLIGHSVQDDYEIFESMPDGVRCGRLSFYKGAEVVVYRIDDESIALRAAQEASCFGRAGYDYILFINLLAQANNYWRINGFKPVPYTWFKSNGNSNLICTELVALCYERVNFPLVPQRIVPTPAAIKAAYEEGRTRIVYEDKL